MVPLSGHDNGGREFSIVGGASLGIWQYWWILSIETILFSSLQKLSIHRDSRAFKLRPYVTARPAMPTWKKCLWSETAYNWWNGVTMTKWKVYISCCWFFIATFISYTTNGFQLHLGRYYYTYLDLYSHEESSQLKPCRKQIQKLKVTPCVDRATQWLRYYRKTGEQNNQEDKGFSSWIAFLAQIP